jgi:CheY-like chemotaxis protein
MRCSRRDSSFNHSGVAVDKVLRILILGDQNTHTDLMEHELRKEGLLFSSRRVQTKEDFLRELKDFAPDLILSDYKLPLFGGSSAIAIAKKHCPDVLFVFVSGTNKKEEPAIGDKVF